MKKVATSLTLGIVLFAIAGIYTQPTTLLQRDLALKADVRHSTNVESTITAGDRAESAKPPTTSIGASLGAERIQTNFWPRLVSPSLKADISATIGTARVIAEPTVEAAADPHPSTTMVTMAAIKGSIIHGGIQALSGSMATHDTEYGLPSGFLTAPQATNDGKATKMVVQKSGIVKNLIVNLSTSPGGNGGNANIRTFTLLKTSHGVTTTSIITLSIAGAATMAKDIIHNFSVSAGDELSMEIVTSKPGDIPVSIANAEWSFTLDCP